MKREITKLEKTARTLTPVPLKLTDSPILNIFLKSKIWGGDTSIYHTDQLSDNDNNHTILTSKGKSYRTYELLCLLLMHYNRKDEFEDDRIVEIDFNILLEQLNIHSKYDFRLAERILKEIRKLRSVLLTIYTPKKRTDEISSKIDSLVSKIKVSVFGTNKLETTHRCDYEDEPLIEAAEFIKSKKVYRIKLSSLIVSCYQTYNLKYQHVDIIQFIKLSNTAKSLHRYFSTKYNIINVKRSTLINFAHIKPSQSSKTLNYKIKKWLKELEELNIIKVLEYKSRGAQKCDPIIKVLIIHKKDR